MVKEVFGQNSAHLNVIGGVARRTTRSHVSSTVINAVTNVYVCLRVFTVTKNSVPVTTTGQPRKEELNARKNFNSQIQLSKSMSIDIWNNKLITQF